MNASSSSDDDDAPTKPRYRPGDVLIEHDDLVDADVPPPSLESKVGINVADIDELVGDSAYRGMLVDENTGQRIAPRFAWIVLGLQFFFALMIYLFAYNHFNILQNVAPVPYCVDNAPGYLSRAASSRCLLCASYHDPSSATQGTDRARARSGPVPEVQGI